MSNKMETKDTVVLMAGDDDKFYPVILDEEKTEFINGILDKLFEPYPIQVGPAVEGIEYKNPKEDEKKIEAKERLSIPIATILKTNTDYKLGIFQTVFKLLLDTNKIIYKDIVSVNDHLISCWGEFPEVIIHKKKKCYLYKFVLVTSSLDDFIEDGLSKGTEIFAV